MTDPTLEDEAIDIISKAARGLGHAVPPHADDAAWRAAADQLNLDSDRLLAIAHDQYRPDVQPPAGFHVFTTRWADMDVNAGLAIDPDSPRAVVFDTGADAAPLLEFIRSGDLTIAAVFITHTHTDHIAGLDTIRRTAGPDLPVYSPADEPVPDTTAIIPGESKTIGSLTIEARLSSGHSPGGLTFVISGLARPVAVVGDALFAGSIGGPNICYQDSLRGVRESIFTLPGNTLICPGHGPLTSVDLEMNHNPFFPEFPGKG